MGKGYRIFCYIVALALFAGAGFCFYHAATSQEHDQALALGAGRRSGA